MLRHSLYVYTKGLMLPDFMTFFGSFWNWNQKVLNPFVVDFHHRYVNLVVFVGIVVLGNSGENLFAGDGHDSLNGTELTLLAP